MKVLVPFSGLGTNSTYGMYRWLTETDYEVVALFLDMYYSSDGYTEFEREHFHKTVKWFKDNIRDFVAIERECPRFFSKDFRPIQEGFTHQFDSSVQRNRRKVYIEVAKEFKADLISSGRSAEDRNTPPSGKVSVFEGSGYDFVIPAWSLTERVTVENSDRAIREMTAKWSQREKLPQELRNIITNCRCKGELGCCYWCNDLLLNEVRPETGQELDDVIVRKLCSGKFRHLADPKTYKGSLERNWRYVELLGYDFPSCIGDPAVEDEVSTKAKAMYSKAGNI
tara:strand:+ start:38 stop:883 length:846 start_codon:yes stop_codon:yes gene_type:complete